MDVIHNPFLVNANKSDDLQYIQMDHKLRKMLKGDLRDET